MPVAPRGTIEERHWNDGRTISWRLRVPLNGRRYSVVLGTNHQGWSRQRAEVELERIVGMLERGTWRPPGVGYVALPPASVDPMQDETVAVTADRWWRRRESELRPNTREDYRWRLRFINAHLATERTAAVTIQRVDEFRDRLKTWRSPQHGKPLSARSVNMVLDTLAQILDDAVEYGLLAVNPARGKRRRLPVRPGPRSFLEADMVLDLLNAAGEWETELLERKRPDQCYGRRALLALLCLAGPRISEALAADRGDFDLTQGRWRIPAAKTSAGERDVELSAFLAAELRNHVATMQSLGRGPTAHAPMWATNKGKRLSPSNVRRRAIAMTVARVNEQRAEREAMLLPPSVTPHSLRRTFASLALAFGRDPRWVMAMLGHTDARLTLSVYAQMVTRKGIDRELIGRLMEFPGESVQARERDHGTEKSIR